MLFPLALKCIAHSRSAPFTQLVVKCAYKERTSRPKPGVVLLEVNVVKVGNSKGVRIPAPFLKQLGISERVSMEVEGDALVIRPVGAPRQGWEEAFKRMRGNDDDLLLVEEILDDDMLKGNRW